MSTTLQTLAKISFRLLSLVTLLTVANQGVAQHNLTELRGSLVGDYRIIFDSGQVIDAYNFEEGEVNPDFDTYVDTYLDVVILDRRLSQRIKMISRSTDDKAKLTFVDTQQKWFIDRDKKCNQYWDPVEKYPGDRAPLMYMRCLGKESLKRLEQLREGKFRRIYLQGFNNKWLEGGPSSLGNLLVSAFLKGELKAYTTDLVSTKLFGNEDGWPLPGEWSGNSLYFIDDSVQFHGQLYKAREYSRNVAPGNDSTWHRYTRSKKILNSSHTLPGGTDLLTKETFKTRLVASVQHRLADPWERTIDYEPGGIAQDGKKLYTAKKSANGIQLSDTAYWELTVPDVSIGDTIRFKPEVDFTELTMLEYLEYSGKDTTYYPQMIEVGAVDPQMGYTRAIAAFRFVDVIQFLQKHNELIVTPSSFLTEYGDFLKLNNETIKEVLSKYATPVVDTLDTFLDILSGRKFTMTYFADVAWEKELGAQLAYSTFPLIKPTPLSGVEFEVEFIVTTSSDVVPEPSKVSPGESCSVVYKITYNTKTKAYSYEVKMVKVLAEVGSKTEWTAQQYFEALRKNPDATKMKSNVEKGAISVSHARRLTGFNRTTPKVK